MAWLDVTDALKLHYIFRELLLWGQVASNQKEPLTMALLYRIQRRLTSLLHKRRPSDRIQVTDGSRRSSPHQRDHQRSPRGRYHVGAGQTLLPATPVAGQDASPRPLCRTGTVPTLKGSEAILFLARSRSTSLSVWHAYQRSKIKLLGRNIGLDTSRRGCR